MRFGNIICRVMDFIVFCFVHVQLASCLLRRTFNKDSHTYAIPAGLIASTAFMAFPNNTITLYFMWKALQVLLHIRTYICIHVTEIYIISFFYITCYFVSAIVEWRSRKEKITWSKMVCYFLILFKYIYSFPRSHNGTAKLKIVLLEISLQHVWWKVSIEKQVYFYFYCLESILNNKSNTSIFILILFLFSYWF